MKFVHSSVKRENHCQFIHVFKAEQYFCVAKQKCYLFLPLDASGDGVWQAIPGKFLMESQ